MVHHSSPPSPSPFPLCFPCALPAASSSPPPPHTAPPPSLQRLRQLTYEMPCQSERWRLPWWIFRLAFMCRGPVCARMLCLCGGIAPMPHCSALPPPLDANVTGGLVCDRLTASVCVCFCVILPYTSEIGFKVLCIKCYNSDNHRATLEANACFCVPNCMTKI